jgi:hypothetical protein
MCKKLLIAIIVILIPSIPFLGTVEPGLSEAITNTQNTKESGGKSIGPSFKEPYVHWVYSTNSSVSSVPVIGKNDVVYFTTEHDLIAVDKLGSKIWSWHCNDILNNPKQDRDSILYVTSDKGMLYAINANGKELWHYQASVGSAQNPVYSCTSCTVGKDDSIYFMIVYEKPVDRSSIKDYGSMLFAVNKSGTLKWSVNTNKSSLFASEPAVNDSGIVFVQYLYRSSFRFFSGYAYDTIIDSYDSDGKLLWEQATSGSLDSKYIPLVLNGNNGIFAGVDTKLYSFDSSGYRKNYYQFNNTFSYGNGLVKASDDCLIITSGSTVYCLNPDFTEKWKFTANSNINSTPALGPNGLVYFSTEKGVIYCIDLNGTQKWEETFADNIIASSLAVVSNGTIYQLTSRGDLNAIVEIKSDSFSLNAHEVTLLSNGMKGILKPVNHPRNAKLRNVKWSSDNAKVATVQDGIITPISEGTAIVKVCSEEVVLDTCKVTVSSKPFADLTLGCDIILGNNGYSHQGIYTFQNLTLKDGITITSEGISEVELIVKGTLSIGKDATIRVRNGYHSNAPDMKISSITSDSLHKITTQMKDTIVSLPILYGKGGNGGNGGNGSHTPDIKVTFLYQGGNSSLETSSGGGGGAGGYGGGLGGGGSIGGRNFFLELEDIETLKEREEKKLGHPILNYNIPTATINEEAGKGLAGGNNGESGGNVNDIMLFSQKSEIALLGGNGGEGNGIGERGSDGKSLIQGGSGGGGNGGDGGGSGEKDYKKKNGLAIFNINPPKGAGGGGGGGGGYGGGVLVIAANSINVQKGELPCFIVAGQKGGKGGYPNGKDGENGEGGMLVIETNNYKPLLSHWNLGDSTMECSNSDINGGHGTVTGNPQKVFINGIDVSNYTDNSIKTFDSSKRSASLIQKIGGKN